MTRRRWFAAATVVLTLLAAAAWWVTNGEFWAIDSCLDSGGAWNAAEAKCER